MITPALLVFCLVLGALVVFQGMLVAGAPLGHFAWGGQHRVLPTRLRVGSLISIALYLLFMLVLSDRSGFWPWLPEGFSGAATWLLVAYLGLGILMNSISRSSPERYTMTPVAALLFGCSLIIALA